MSGFSPDWLQLREPADHASINAGVRLALSRHFTGRETLRVVDLGAGAGSNLRGLAPYLSGLQHWTHVDYDARLIDAARQRLAAAPIAGCEVVFRQADFSGGDFAPLIAGADLVTAAALFDLVSATVIDKLAAAVAAEARVFATHLTYDGLAAFLPEHPADAAMRAAFNQHQTGDKGFGPAEGPRATATLAAAFEKRGYRVLTGKSPWVLDQRFARLRRELDSGWAGAVKETGRVPVAELERWLAHRTRATDAEAVTIVGHEDLLALPPR